VHSSGAYALSQAGQLEQLSRFRPEAIARVIRGIARHFDALVLDGLRDFEDPAIYALDLADRVLLVVTEDVPSVRGAVRCLDIFRRIGFPDSRLTLVVNRHRPGAPVQPAAIAEALRLPVAATIANEFEVVEQAINDGVALADVAPRAKVTRDLESLAVRLLQEASGGPAIGAAPAPSAQAAGGVSGFFGKLLGKGAGK
jgi:pilus assembly protein CpaE